MLCEAAASSRLVTIEQWTSKISFKFFVTNVAEEVLHLRFDNFSCIKDDIFDNCTVFHSMPSPTRLEANKSVTFKLTCKPEGVRQFSPRGVGITFDLIVTSSAKEEVLAFRHSISGDVCVNAWHFNMQLD
jgi:hypothetical protein